MSQGKRFSLKYKAVFLLSVSKIHTENVMDKGPKLKLVRGKIYVKVFCYPIREQPYTKSQGKNGPLFFNMLQNKLRFC